MLKEESSASNKLPSQSGEEFLPDNKTKQHRSLRELEMMLEMKEKELEEQAKATKEYKVCPSTTKIVMTKIIGNLHAPYFTTEAPTCFDSYNQPRLGCGRLFEHAALNHGSAHLSKQSSRDTSTYLCLLFSSTLIHIASASKACVHTSLLKMSP